MGLRQHFKKHPNQKCAQECIEGGGTKMPYRKFYETVREKTFLLEMNIHRKISEDLFVMLRYS